MSRLPLARLGGEPGWAEYVLYGVGLAGLHVFAGFLVARLWIFFELEEATPPRRAKVASRLGGFTLVELLTVIAIVAVIAAVLFPVVVRVKRSARYAEDLSDLRQIYTAITIYEGDSDRESPPSLLTLESTGAVPAALLQSKTDTRNASSRQEWPANIWVDILDTDGTNATLTSRTMISFGYLKPFEKRFPRGTTFATYREDPNVAILIDPAVGECRDARPGDETGCVFTPDGQPPVNIDAWLAIRTDGSAIRVHIPPPPCHSGGFSYEQLFLFWPVCGGATATGGK